MSPAKPPENRSRLKNVTLFTEEDDLGPKPNDIPLEKIILSNQQPRRYFDPQKLAGLVTSIKQHGILEPLLVRPLISGGYELVAGERRYRAATQIGLDKVPAVIREMGDIDALQFALIENLQREDLNPVEETEGVLKLLALNLEKEETEIVSLLYRMLDEAKGKVPHNVMGNSEAAAVRQVFEGIALMEWQSFVSNRLPLLNLPEEVLSALRQGHIAYTKAQAIARLKDKAKCQALLEESIKENFSLSQIRERISMMLSKPEAELAPLKARVDVTYRLVKQSKIWDDPKKKKRLEKLLAQMEALLTED